MRGCVVIFIAADKGKKKSSLVWLRLTREYLRPHPLSVNHFCPLLRVRYRSPLGGSELRCILRLELLFGTGTLSGCNKRLWIRESM